MVRKLTLFIVLAASLAVFAANFAPTQTGLAQPFGPISPNPVPIGVLPGGLAPCAFDMVINTGTKGVGAPDPLWTLFSAPSSGVPPQHGVTPYPGWTTPPTGSGVAWIDPNDTSIVTSQPAGDYWYSLTTFDLTGFYNPQLIFNFAADNSVEFFLNPNPWSSSPPPASSLSGLGYADSSIYAFQALHAGWPITQSTTPALNIGLNTLYAHVTNEAGGDSPTGLLVAGDVTADCVPPPPPCDLAITKTMMPNPVPSGGTVTVTLTVKNVGQGPCPGPANGVVTPTTVNDTAPAGLAFTPGTQTTGLFSWTITSANASGTSSQTIPANYSDTVSFTGTVSAPAGSTITNCATVANVNDLNSTNNQSCATITVTVPAPGPCVPGTTPLLNIGTGRNGSGAVDTQWHLTSGPVTGSVYGVQTYGPWAAPVDAFDHWIDVSTAGVISNANDPTTATAGGTYVYLLSFTVPTTYTSAPLTFQFAADNSVDLYLDASTTPIPGASMGGIFGFQALHGPVTVPSIPAGPHTLKAVVQNAGNVTGLLVEGRVC